MEQAGPDWHGFGERPGRPYRLFVLIVLAVAAALVVASFVVRATDGGEDADEAPLSLKPSTRWGETRSVSIDFALVTDPETSWEGVSTQLEQAGANAVNLNAGRVEFTAFDWKEHPDAAAEPGTDHLAAAARALQHAPGGQERQVSLIVDAFVPRWIADDPSIAGVSVDGTRGKHSASASQLAKGEVGDRLVAYVAELGERYEPAGIEITELFFSAFTYGDDDLALFREMTGAEDWPRTDDGAVDEQSPQIARWRSDVVAGVLQRMRTALDAVRGGAGRDITLMLDVRVDWDQPAVGSPASGHDYEVLLSSVPGLRLEPWAYVGLPPRPPADVEVLTAALRNAGYDMGRFEISVGLWTSQRDPDGSPGTITAQTLQSAVRAAGTNGITAVNVTPYSLMTQEDWSALAAVWAAPAG